MLEFRATKDVELCKQHKGIMVAPVDHCFQVFDRDFMQLFAPESCAWAMKCERARWWWLEAGCRRGHSNDAATRRSVASPCNLKLSSSPRRPLRALSLLTLTSNVGRRAACSLCHLSSSDEVGAASEGWTSDASTNLRAKSCQRTILIRQAFVDPRLP